MLLTTKRYHSYSMLANNSKCFTKLKTIESLLNIGVWISRQLTAEPGSYLLLRDFREALEAQESGSLGAIYQFTTRELQQHFNQTSWLACSDNQVRT
jgi:hypothetical protein